MFYFITWTKEKIIFNGFAQTLENVEHGRISHLNSSEFNIHPHLRSEINWHRIKCGGKHILKARISIPKKPNNKKQKQRINKQKQSEYYHY